MTNRFRDGRLLNVCQLSNSLIIFVGLLPSTFFGFQNHHDGYTLETSRLIATGIGDNSPFPFSQYGPIWSIILGTFSLLLPSPLVIIGMRITSVLCYAFSFKIADQIREKIVGRKLENRFSILFVVSWYLFGPYYAWPSTFALLFTLLSARLILRAINSKNSRSIPFIIGAICTLTSLCRFQIGITSLIGLLLIYIYLVDKQASKGFVSGFLSSITLIGIILWYKDWLTSSFYDLVIFAAKYHVSSDRGAERVPKFTLLIALLTIAISQIFQKRVNLSRYLYNRTFSLCVICLIALYISDSIRSTRFTSYIRWVLLQRLFAGLVMALLFFVLIYIWRFVFRNFGKSKQGIFENKKSVLAVSILAMCSYTQNYPLFSAHHAWYSCLPLLLAVNLFSKQPAKEIHVSKPLFLVSLMLIMLLFYSITQMKQSGKAPFKEYVRIEKTQIAHLNSVKDTLDNLVPKNSTIINLCSDPTIYLLRPDLKSKSRIYVWWDRFEQFDQYVRQIKQPSQFLFVCEERGKVLWKIYNELEWARIGIIVDQGTIEATIYKFEKVQV